MRRLLSTALEVHPQVALRPEPFGALAYHYDNRRLVFLRSRDMLNVVESLSTYSTLEDALVASDIEPQRWQSFESAIDSLISSEIVRVR
ncbi:MAG: mycofactocin biosynthesis chaperone MftB [Actinobacteria bacterium]|nr:mycofactocin biosynthesis chaperone MftB [Actinomycetota bacterium]